MNSQQLQELRSQIVILLDTAIDTLLARDDAFRQSTKESAERSKEGIQRALDWFQTEHPDETQIIEMFQRSLKNCDELISDGTIIQVS
jgi:hypothetical protein